MIDAFSELVLRVLGLLLLSGCWGVHWVVHRDLYWEGLGGTVRRRGVDCELEVLDCQQMEFGSEWGGL